MNEEFHYYIVAFLCKEAGLPAEDTRIISYASQYTDNALVPYDIETDRGIYRTQVTHHFGFWDKSQESDVWMPFHFIPGEEQKNRFSVAPASKNAKALLVAALKTRNPYRIGIALHGYADTWAHQNFTGRREEWNVIDSGSIIPPIGHAQALRKPDDIYEEWQDPRGGIDAAPVSNYQRFTKAARAIYKYLATYNHRDYEDVDFVMERLKDILGTPKSPRSAEERKLDLLIEANVDTYRRNDWKGRAVVLNEETGDEGITPGYDKLLWLKHEVLHKTGFLKPRRVQARPSFYTSDYYEFHEAAKDHRGQARRVFGALLD